MINLIPEMKIEILNHLDAVSLKRMIFTNTEFSQMARTNSLWNKFLALPRAPSEPLYEIFLKKKRRETFQLAPLIQKLFVLVEAKDLNAIKELIPKIDKSVTSLLHTSSTKQTLASLITDQRDQVLNDYFFNLVYEEYCDSKSLVDIVLTAPSFRRFGNTPMIRNSSEISLKFDEMGYTLFIWACVFDQINFVKRFDRKPDSFTTVGFYVKSAFTIACTHGSMRVLQAFLDEAADVSYMNYLPMRDAVKNGQYEVVESLLKIANTDKKSLFNLAISGGHVKIAALILDAFPKEFDEETLKRALRLAVAESQAALTMYLYRYVRVPIAELLENINLNQVRCVADCLQFLLDQEDGHEEIKSRLLQEAVCKDYHNETVRILLSKGARNEMALERAIIYGCIANIKLLLNHGVVVKEDLIRLAASGNPEVVNLLLSYDKPFSRTAS